jgi:thymidylate kinase
VRRALLPLLRRLDRRTRLRRRSGLAVALLAPDGAGKTTLAQALRRSFYFPARVIYMGMPRHDRGARRLRRQLGLAVRYRLGAFQRRHERLVIFDRYPIGEPAAHGRAEPRLKRYRRWAGQRLYPLPDLVVYLDAPAEVLQQRKQEHSIAVLNAQRARFLAWLGTVPQSQIVDARRDPEQVRRTVTAMIWRHYAGSSGRRHAGGLEPPIHVTPHSHSAQ